jgi:hypothetical protein
MLRRREPGLRQGAEAPLQLAQPHPANAWTG